MIQKHVDLIAIALLLAGITFCAHARNGCVLGLRSARMVSLKPHYQGSHIYMPAIPRISFARD